MESKLSMRKNFSGADLKPDELQKPELQIARALVEARQMKHVTQQQLAERTGIAQADISRLENGNSNPTLRTLQRLADGLEMTVEVGFKDTATGDEDELVEAGGDADFLEDEAIDDEEDEEFDFDDDDDEEYEYDEDFADDDFEDDF